MKLLWEVRVGGVAMQGLVDTGSQVTLVTESLYERKLQSAACHTFRFTLTAANGRSIPTVGCIVTSISHEGSVVPDCVVVVVKDAPGQPDCLLGMNFLTKLPNFLPPLIPDPLSKTYLAKAPRVAMVIPARTVQHVTLTAGPTDGYGTVLMEPAANSPVDGLALIPTFVQLRDGRARVPVMNISDEDLWLPSRAVVGVMSSASSDISVNIISASEGGDVGRGGVTSPLGERARQETANPDTSTAKPCVSSSPINWEKLAINKDLEDKQADEVRALIREYQDLFAWTDRDLGSTDLIEHEIHLVEELPIAQPYRRIPPSVLGEVKDHIRDLLDRDIIAPSSSPFASPIVVVRKKSGELRLCIDYRRLNRVTRKDSFPLPRIEESLDALGGAKFFTSLDLASGYYQVKMADKTGTRQPSSARLGYTSSRGCPLV